MSESNTNSTSAEAEKDKNAKINNSYVIGAGLLVLGIIVGVLFYGMLMRIWGVKEVSVVDVKTSASREITLRWKPLHPKP